MKKIKLKTFSTLTPDVLLHNFSAEHATRDLCKMCVTVLPITTLKKMFNVVTVDPCSTEACTKLTGKTVTSIDCVKVATLRDQHQVEHSAIIEVED